VEGFDAQDVVGRRGGGRRNDVRVDGGDKTPPTRAGPGSGRECIRLVACFEPQADGEVRGLIYVPIFFILPLRHMCDLPLGLLTVLRVKLTLCFFYPRLSYTLQKKDSKSLTPSGAHEGSTSSNLRLPILERSMISTVSFS